MIFHFGTAYRWLTHTGDPQGELVSKVHFMGQRDRTYTGLGCGGSIDFLGVRFKPGGLAAFTRTPVASLLNRMIPATELMGPFVGEWEDQLYEESSDEQRIALLEKLLCTRIINLPSEGPALRRAIDLIRYDPAGAVLDTICRETGWHYKKLERNFAKAVGYMPKQYARIVRLNKAIRQVDAARRTLRKQSATLTSIGYDCGYYDQSHFIKDFIQYVGIVPGQFMPDEQTITGLLIRHQPA